MQKSSVIGMSIDFDYSNDWTKLQQNWVVYKRIALEDRNKFLIRPTQRFVSKHTTMAWHEPHEPHRNIAKHFTQFIQIQLSLLISHRTLMNADQLEIN